jgi:hypothetical protein
MNQQHTESLRKRLYRLIASRALTLPGKKKLVAADNQIEVVVVDVTETPIERPKKNRKDFTVEKRENIHSNLKS